MWEFGRASDAEALRLVVAFLKIKEPERRRELIELAEMYQSITRPLPQPAQHMSQDNTAQRRCPIRRS
jgi:hypothetical protein